MRLPPHGVIGLHQASGPQLLAVVEGEGWFRGQGEGRTRVTAGEAIFWNEGEWHETGTDGGLVAIVIESPHLVEGESLGPVVGRSNPHTSS
ncbi:MAG TPA: cupin domain-containing protein [Candidatus Dormibacteraeota bacterium]|nr:cupin domain-containing protein [Candidatus Dormibacteraeota bacterium]